jgi:hypothetical protein
MGIGSSGHLAIGPLGLTIVDFRFRRLALNRQLAIENRP